MALLHAGVDTSVIALWMGHEDPPPPEHADMKSKDRFRLAPADDQPNRSTSSW
jgi:integrase/recombinase XerD